MLLKHMLHFYYRMALNELRAMNAGDYYHGLSYNSLLYLNVISMMEDCTVSTLATALNVSKPGVTAKINELVKAGAVIKRRSEHDKRVIFIELSPSMEQTIHIYNKVFENMEREMREKYSPEQLALFCSILGDIADFTWEGSDE